MSQRHLEVEDKYDAEPSFRLPSLDGLAGVTRVGGPVVSSLQATYLDTADLRLARRGITLRHRAGGEDDGWHLKLPVAWGERTEVHHPLGRSRRQNPPVPAALLRLVRAYLRDAEVGPVARLRTERTVYRLYGRDDVALADLADDQVTGQALGADVTVRQWREVEVELIDGDRDLLAVIGGRLREAGAAPARIASKLARTLSDRLAGAVAGAPMPIRPDRAGAVVHAYLAQHVTALLAADAGVREDLPDAVHQMRVATRRLRSSLATYRTLFERDRTEPVRAELKWLGGILGEVRDTEVMQARLIAALDELPGELVLGPVRGRVRHELRTQHRQGRQQLIGELGGARYFRLLDTLDGLVEAPPFADRADGDAEDVVSRCVAREWKRLRARQAAADSAATAAERDPALHEARKAAKRARYAAEAAAPMAGAPAERFVRRMKDLQTMLGSYQDSVVASQLLRTMGARAYLAGENGFTFGLLHGLEFGRGAQARSDCRRAWDKAGKRRLRRWLR